MAYALIVWQPPPNGDTAYIELDVLSTLAAVNPPQLPVQFLDRMVLYPSQPGGVGFSTVRSTVQDLVRRHPGLELMIVMPPEGSVVAGWFTEMQGSLADARSLMNMPGGPQTYPRVLPPEQP